MPDINSLHHRVLFSDGEALDHTDLNSIQSLLMTTRNDLINGYVFPPATNGAEGDTDLLWRTTQATTVVMSPRGGEAYPIKSTGLGVGCRRGWIMQRGVGSPNTPDGNIPVMLAAFLPETTTIVTLSAADPTNPRIDLIQVRIKEIDDTSTTRDFKDAITLALSSIGVNKRKRTVAEFTVKTGTPAASPTPPAPDAGFGEWCRVRVPATAVTLVEDDIWDMRYPSRVMVAHVHPYMLGRVGSDPWVIDTGQVIAVVKPAGAPGANDFLVAFPPMGDQAVRIVGIYINGVFQVTDRIGSIVRHDDNSGTLAHVELGNFTTALGMSTLNLRGKVATPTGNTGIHAHRPLWNNYYGPQDERVFRVGSTATHGNFFRNAFKINAGQLSRCYGAGFYLAY